MKDQTEQVLATLLERAVQGIEEAVAFSQAQIPDVVEQLLVWEMVHSAILMCIGIVILVFSSAAFFRSSEYDGGMKIASISLMALGFFMAISSLDWLQILIAPKLYLLEYAAKLVG